MRSIFRDPELFSISGQILASTRYTAASGTTCARRLQRVMRERPKSRARLVVCQLALASAIVLAWQWAAISHRLDPFFFSRPSDVVLRVAPWVRDGTLWAHIAQTFAVCSLSF